MAIYAFPIKVALLTFPILAFLLALPLLIKEYRKYGAFPLIKGFILYSFIFYMLCAFFLVILPLPPRTEVAQMTTMKIQLRPFANVSRFLTETVLDFKDPRTYLPALKQGVVLEPLFNILLTIPFGVYLRYYFNFSFKKTMLLGFCLSFFFEFTQFTGLYFIYPRPYRLADVDDLINNTLGAVIGYGFAPVVEKIFPAREKIDVLAYEKGQNITLTRRFVAFLIDWVLINFVTNSIEIFLSKSLIQNLVYLVFSRILQVLLYFIVLPTFFEGRTVGKKIVRIKVVRNDGQKGQFKDFFSRYTWLYSLTSILSIGASYFNRLFNENNTDKLFSILTTVYLGLFFAFVLLLFGLLIAMEIDWISHKPFYYERLSQTKEINDIKSN